MALMMSVWEEREDEEGEGAPMAGGVRMGCIPYRFIHDDDGGRAQPALRLHQGIEVHQHRLTHRLGQQRRGGAAWDDGQQVVPAPTDTSCKEDGQDRQLQPCSSLALLRHSPACFSMSSFSGTDISSSTVQGVLTCPEMLKSLVPEFRSRPKLANQAPPRRQIVGATDTVSTLATVVGQPNTPGKNIRKKFLSVRVVMPWHKRPEDAVAAPCLEMSKARFNKAWSNLGLWYVALWKWGVMRVSFQVPYSPHHSMKQWELSMDVVLAVVLSLQQDFLPGDNYFGVAVGNSGQGCGAVPTSAGKGGFRRGFPCLPSMDSMRAVSSPQM